jgi:hypothetical protein
VKDFIGIMANHIDRTFSRIVILVGILMTCFMLPACTDPEPQVDVSSQPQVELSSGLETLHEEFLRPPSSAKPGVYWYFMDGNQDRDEMTGDLEAMAKVGIMSVVFLEVNIGVPRGPVDFMSEEWQDNFAHAVKTAERLGMEVILGTGPGWAGSGGPWIKPEDAMQHLVGSPTKVVGPARFNDKLEVPKPLEANHFAGLNEEWEKVRDEWYQDVAVLAFPTPEGDATFELANLKILKDTTPYSIWKHTVRYVPASAAYTEPAAESVIQTTKVIDITDRMQAGGTLEWDVPEGEWTIMRFVARATGQTTRPAPVPGHGFENDKFSQQSFLNHWDNFQGELLKKARAGKNSVGWTRIHLDSWEMSSQNWTQGFREEFQERRGYDPLPWYPAYAGMVVGSLEKTERFLWDLRKTAQELVLENHAGAIKAKAHEHGMLYSNEPYDMNPAGDIDLGSVADIPMCEFWDYRIAGVDAFYSCVEAASIAHVMGRPRLGAEAFTTSTPYRYHSYPGQMKNQTDWALAMGINNFMFHTFQHQPLGDDFKPGMSMQAYGVNWHRNQTWWDMLPAYHSYISRASHLLQQGVTVSDVLYLTPEGAPHIFLAPPSAYDGEGRLRDKRGYGFDAVSPRLLMNRASVKNGRIAFPEASEYKILVLPDDRTMTPEALEKIMDLVESGATVMGNPPVKSPSLVNYPDSDEHVRTLATTLWGSLDVPEEMTKRQYGAGTIYWGQDIYPEAGGEDAFYPTYDRSAGVLQEIGLVEDFIASENSIRYTHRRMDNQDIYFMANRSDKAIAVDGTFRVSDMTPELWHPQTGERRALPNFKNQQGTVSIALKFAPYESYFVVFSREPKIAATGNENFPAYETAMKIDGSWDVAFDAKFGGPESISFDQLQDWSKHADRGVKYYSGTATYTKAFDLPPGLDPSGHYSIDLGKAYEMARVSLNGVELGIAWTAPWRVPAGDTLKASGNILTIEVANSWENRLIGDDTAEDKDVRTLQWQSGLLEGKPYKTGRFTFSTIEEGELADLQPSGLIGPVRLVKRK